MALATARCARTPTRGASRPPSIIRLLAALGALLMAAGCGSPSSPSTTGPATAAPLPRPTGPLPPVMLGIDVLEADGFRAVAGKRIGLLTHPAGVNRRGERTLDVLRRARNTTLVALFAVEHGLYGNIPASTSHRNARHPATGLPIYSLYTGNPSGHKPTPAMLKGIDALVIDLQDIGVRSYTFTSAMLCAMAGCFEAGVEVIVLDRPNPLGGWKVDGPPLDADLKSYVGAFQMPYVHGLTIGELARLARNTPHAMVIPKVIKVSERVRLNGKLTVIPMRGWNRRMEWPDTGLKWIPTSGLINDYDAVVGYAMAGLGTLDSGWSTGLGPLYPFRALVYPGKKPDQVIAELRQYQIAGLTFRKIQSSRGRAGVYVHVTDWNAWRPTELSFYLQKIAAKWSPRRFAQLDGADTRTFNIHVGSKAWLAALKRDGARVNAAAFIAAWSGQAASFQQQSRKFWLYQ